jgi:putative endonuclease
MRIKNSSCYYVYITTNPGKRVLYCGMTNDLKRRLNEHYASRGLKDHFASRYFCYKLVYYEEYTTATEAIHREKDIKSMLRRKKLELISTKNPGLNFLSIY